MKTSDQINELAGALAKAQGGFSNPARNREVEVSMKSGGKYKFAYATFDAILDVVRKPLADNGLAFIQAVTIDSDWVLVTTRLAHVSGQWIEETLPIKPNDFGPQSVGSATTYAKRYSLTAILGIAADEDDDANAASGNHVEQSNERTPPRRGPQTKAQQVAAQHGMKTGDQLPGAESAADVARKSIDKAVADRNADLLAKIETRVLERHKEGLISEADYLDLVGRLATAGDKLLQPA